MLRKFGFLGFVAILLVGAAGFAAATPSAPGAKVFFVDLKDGDIVKSPFTVHFGISGMSLAPAGTDTPNTGHHHLLINTTLEGGALKQPIPNDEHHLHFGKAQTETVLTLPPGKYTLQLVLGDWSHVPHDPPVMSAPITITVQ
ncbi:MAG: DUF4399 domain-containing protein [Beijerinckiaceae bacterium]